LLGNQFDHGTADDIQISHTALYQVTGHIYGLVIRVGCQGAVKPSKNFCPPKKCFGSSLKILDIVQKIWAPPRIAPLVSQACYGPAHSASRKSSSTFP